jgi:hypothetical protein
MVRAILAGKKTQTRRKIKYDFPSDESVRKVAGTGYGICQQQGGTSFNVTGPVWAFRQCTRVTPIPAPELFPCPYGQIGDRLWVKETWRPGMHTEFLCAVQYKADLSWKKPEIQDENQGFEFASQCAEEPEKWTSPLFMRRWASRITKKITCVRVQRINDISDQDCIAEGIERLPSGAWNEYRNNRPGNVGWERPRSSYETLWSSINGPDSWSQNPWVWVIEF